MRIIHSIKQMHQIAREFRCRGYSVGFIPTMGALHPGHLSLIHRARQENDRVIVSIFVNPTQFGPHEDFKKYPRDLKKDALLCRRERVDIVFYPDVKEMYPDNYKTYVTVEDLSSVLCGKFRPGHFRGVTTIVSKLFNIVQPDIAYFGQKDAQQAIIIKRMVEDLNIPLKIKVIPTLREKDGIALSSRNVYLSEDQRKSAVVLYQALSLAKKLIKQGKRNSLDIIRKMKQFIQRNNKIAKIQYISIVDVSDLKPLDKIKGKVLVVLALWLGNTRLIDNVTVNPVRKDRSRYK